MLRNNPGQAEPLGDPAESDRRVLESVANAKPVGPEALKGKTSLVSWEVSRVTNPTSSAYSSAVLPQTEEAA